jgi:hypothetical protein
MLFRKYILLLLAILSLFVISPTCFGQNKNNLPKDKMQTPDGGGFRVTTYVYHGDTIPNILYPSVVIYPPMQFANDEERMEFIKLVYNVKKVLPIAIEINNLIIETYEYLETLPNDKAKTEMIKKVEKGIKEQYTARMKKLSYKQGKLLIKLVDRQCNNQTAFDLIKAFMGPLKATFWQVFASVYGASLKKRYDPSGEDKLTERVVVMVTQGQI